jgi:hypothetical protein
MTRYRDKWKWGQRALNCPGKYYELDHPKMIAQRQRFNAQVAARNIDKRLILFYDQLWRNRQRGHKKKMWKPRTDIGQSSHELGYSRSRRIRDYVKQFKIYISSGAPDIGVGNDDDSNPVKAHLMDKFERWAQSSGKPIAEQIQNRMAQDWKKAHTSVTSIWGDGTFGIHNS